MRVFQYFFILFSVILMSSCGSKIKERKDELYSRHLQKHISLTIYSTPVPKNKSDFNLLLLNDEGTFESIDIKIILDSLYRKKLIKPLIIVVVSAFDPKKEFGVTGIAGQEKNNPLADNYADFITNELLPFVKKKSAVRKFNSVSIAGAGMAGISAIDIGWDHWQQFDKIGFLPRISNQKIPIDFSVLSDKILQSRKRPRLQFWMYQADDVKNTATDDSSSINHLISTMENKGGQQVSIIGLEQDRYNPIPINQTFSQFLIWLCKPY